MSKIRVAIEGMSRSTRQILAITNCHSDIWSSAIGGRCLLKEFVVLLLFIFARDVILVARVVLFVFTRDVVVVLLLFGLLKETPCDTPREALGLTQRERAGLARRRRGSATRHSNGTWGRHGYSGIPVLYALCSVNKVFRLFYIPPTHHIGLQSLVPEGDSCVLLFGQCEILFAPPRDLCGVVAFNQVAPPVLRECE